MILTVFSFVFSTLAYFTDTTEFKNNTMTTGSASVEIINLTYQHGSDTVVSPDAAIRIFPGYEVSKTVSARNTGDISLFIRVKIEVDITLAGAAVGRESEIDTSLVGYNIDEEHWMLHTDGYYYYRTTLRRGMEAEPLFTTVKFSEKMGNLYKDSTIKFKVRMEVVSTNGNGTDPINALGWSTPIVIGGDS